MWGGSVVPCTEMMRFLSICVIWKLSGASENIGIVTQVGEFVGNLDRNVEFDGNRRSVIKFLGIPFAKPPVGPRRFKRPEVPDRHPGVYNATYFRPHCAQDVADLPFVSQFKLDEDCLYLNMFVPGDEIKKSNKYSVMIWLYGGAFRAGGADVYNGDILSAFNDVIVVTFNYRVNVFGFLSDGSKSSGNFGLWDQKMAIEWVQDNIETFGGDVKNVTLFGESAGGASVIYQALHVGNENLFQRVIAQSGSAVAPWALQANPVETFISFANKAGCRTGNSETRTECLRRKTWQTLLSSVDSFKLFLPSVDEDFLIDKPSVLLANQSESAFESYKQFSSRDLMIGVNSDDGAYIISSVWENYIKQLFRVNLSNGVPKMVFDGVFVPNMLERLLGISDPLVIKAVLYEYTDWTNEHDTIKVRSNMEDMSTDILFKVPAIETADSHADNSERGSTYFYEFAQKPWFSDMVSQPSWVEGASHTVEIPYVFGLSDSFKMVAQIPAHVPFVKPNVDVKLSMLMMKMWTNFAKTGNPNSPSPTTGQDDYPEWPEYQSDHQPYLRFTTDIDPKSIRHRMVASRFRFWTDLVPALQAKCSSSKLVEYESNTNNSSGATREKTKTIHVFALICFVQVLFSVI